MTPTMNPPPVALPPFAPTSVPPMTADDFFRKHENDRVELVRGALKEMPMPGAEHGMICNEIAYLLTDHAKKHDLGRVMGADTFVRIPGEPATVRGADVLYLSYSKLPKEKKVPHGILEVAPELIVEVRSPNDLWTEVFAKVLDYLRAGVTCVAVVNPMRDAVGVYRVSPDDEQFGIDDTLTFPDILPGFSVPVRKLFE